LRLVWSGRFERLNSNQEVKVTDAGASARILVLTRDRLPNGQEGGRSLMNATPIPSVS